MGRRRNKPVQWAAAGFAGAMVALALVLTPERAAAGVLDFFFGKNERSVPPGVSAYAEPSARVSTAPMRTGSIRPRRLTESRARGFCVRLCDGRPFPLARLANATPVEACRAMCPSAPTKVFFGGEIDHSVARDGQRYTDLDSAYLYRKQLVSNCTCNGRDVFGLVPLDVASDPTLRPGDIVATKDGLMVYTGRSGTKEAFAPVDASTITAQISPGSAHVSLSQRTEPPPAVEDDPGTIVPRDEASQTLPPLVDLRGAQPVR